MMTEQEKKPLPNDEEDEEKKEDLNSFDGN